LAWRLLRGVGTVYAQRFPFSGNILHHGDRRGGVSGTLALEVLNMKLKFSKTTLVGLCMIVGALAEIVRGVASGSGADWQAVGTALAGGVGLLAAADHDVMSSGDAKRR
jgi:hypothetical protein